MSSADISSISASRKNENFAAKPTSANVPQSPISHGLPATLANEGVVYGNRHTHYDLQLPFITSWFERLGEKAKGTKAFIDRKNDKAKAANKKTVRWDGLPGDEKKRLTLDHAFRSESLAFTLNLTREKLARYLKSDRPAKALADAVNKACRSKLGRAVPISLALEISPTGKLHAHGIATVERGEWKGFRDALKSAGGKIEGSASGRQTDTRRLWSATGWTAYMAKAFHETAEAVGTDKLFYQCNATRAGAKAEYEASLQRQKAARRASR
ncbi:hypothetical protein JZX87_10515 [Agrobacterium sp. Ap1]|uniref:hypothetical protein n=1 Tax=Agrobacterium sp. Ap1 TaxID=2815337 RepID=UPI001A8F19E4|nr:hypothetical protein [Agrobacterium sp. Ap1]MBO0141590.1 hypothetical protein [Agrobacterium sp. Ap1]